MSALQHLKSIGEQREFKSFKSLPHGEYIIRKFSSIETIYGKRVRIDFDEGYLLLPDRYNNLTQEEINELNVRPKLMTYNGKDLARKER